MNTKRRLFGGLAVVSAVALGGFGCSSGSNAGSLGSPESSQGQSQPAGEAPSAGGGTNEIDNIDPSASGAAPSTGGTAAGDTKMGDTPLVSGDTNTNGSGMGGMPAAAGEGTGGSATTTGATFHVFLLLGQSNMAGYPKAQPADRVEDPRVLVLGFDNCGQTGRQTDQWDTAAPPLHECWNDGLGPGDFFAKTLLSIIPEGDSIGLVPCAISGERIETFLKVGGARYNYIVNRARLAQQRGGVIEGILFHQGESNTGDPSWPGKVNTLVTDLRADLALGTVPFLAGELLYTGGSAGHNTLVNQLPSLISNAHVISASSLVVDPADTQWNLHFGHDSQVEFGKRYAQKMSEALGW